MKLKNMALLMLGYGGACFLLGVLGSRPVRVKRKFGLDEKTRRRVWCEYLKARSRASADAQATYPVLDPRQDGYDEYQTRQQTERRLVLWEELCRRYTQEVLDSYGLSDKQYFEIELEAVERKWDRIAVYCG